MKFRILATLVACYVLHLDANANTCSQGTTYVRGSDGVSRCVAAVALADIPSGNTSTNTVGVAQNQSQSQTTSQAAGASVTGIGSDLSVSAPMGNSQLIGSRELHNTITLPAPAMAAALPAGFCQTGSSSQISFIGVGYGGSRSKFDAENWEKCAKVAAAMRTPALYELVIGYCERTQQDKMAACISNLMQAAQTTSIRQDAPVMQPVTLPSHPLNVNIYTLTSKPQSKIGNAIKPTCSRFDQSCNQPHPYCYGISLKRLIDSCK